MNTELYESLVKQIKEKLDDYAFIEIPKSVLEEIRTMLREAIIINCKIQKDFDEKNYGAVMMAFYNETSRKYPAFNFLTPFYANFFDIGDSEIKIKSVLEKIMKNEIYYNAFFEIARVDVVKKTYAYAQKQIKNTNENKEFYQKLMEKAEDLGIEQKAVIIDSKPLDYAIIEEKMQQIDDSAYKIIAQPTGIDASEVDVKNEQLEDLYAKKEELQKIVEQRTDGLFNEAALNLGITTEEFEKETGGKSLNSDIDRIVIMPKVLKKVDPIKRLNQNGLRKLIERNKRKRFLQNLDFDYITRDNLNVLIVKPMETLFDKIASGDKVSIDSIIKNASRKEKMSSCISIISQVELSEIVRKLAESYDPKASTAYSDVLSIVNDKDVVAYEDTFEPSSEYQTPEEFLGSINGEQNLGYKRFGAAPYVKPGTTNNVFDSNRVSFNGEDYHDDIPQYKDGESKFIIKQEEVGTGKFKG